MKTKNEKKEVNKFGLERFEVAKLKNLHLIVGGGGDDPIDTNDRNNKDVKNNKDAKNNKVSSAICK